jgi:uncharacterized circularly permuted ATP-grasp superfamily protein/uncharacterized alpha-E superfamily protein
MILPYDPGLGETTTWDPALRSAVLDLEQLERWQRTADRLLMAEGAGHLVHDLPVRADGRSANLESRPWRLDPVPMVVDPALFQWLSAAVAERMEALEAVLVDLYGERRLVTEGIVPPELLHASSRYRMSAIGMPPPQRWLTSYAVDVIRTAEGSWKVVQDLTDAPAGLGYALLDRSVISRVAGEVHTSAGVASLMRFPDLLRRALAGLSDRDSPRTALFSGGIDHPSYIDHSYLAVQLGVHLVEGADLVVRQRRLWIRTLEGIEPVDVVYRRLEGASIDPLEVGSMGSAGVPGLLLAVRSGGVVLANAHGSGVIEDPSLVSRWSEAARMTAGTTLRMGTLEDHSVSHEHFMASPVYGPDGLGGAPVVLRLHAVRGADGSAEVAVLPGGTGRVLAPGDDPRSPTACIAKDVWVIGRTLSPVVAEPLPQVDLASSVPTRAASSLYWMNRAAERVEILARTVRVISDRHERDPGLASLEGGVWADRVQELSRALRRARDDRSDLPGIDALYDEMSRAGDAMAFQIGSLLTEAVSVREFLSVTTGRVLERIARCRISLQRHVAQVDDLDTLLSDLAALAGLWNESTVRGPAWSIGDMGRRLERAQVLLDMVDEVFADPAPTDIVVEEVEQVILEVLLASNESLVAYRRRYRSDVEPASAIALLVRDPGNPRSLAGSLERLAADAETSGWQAGVLLARSAYDALALDLDELVPTVRATLEEFSRALNAHWFAAPVSPVVVTGGGAGPRTAETT